MFRTLKYKADMGDLARWAFPAHGGKYTEARRQRAIARRKRK